MSPSGGDEHFVPVSLSVFGLTSVYPHKYFIKYNPKLKQLVV